MEIEPRSEGAFRCPSADRRVESYERLLAHHGPSLLRLARRVLRNDDEAADALQDAFLAVHRKLDGFRGEAHVSTWLHRVVLNTCLMRLRARRRRPEHPPETLETLLDAGPSAFERLERLQRIERVRRAIDGLAETHRTVLTLCELKEQSALEAARRLGITANAVKIRLCRARRALRAALRPTVESAA